ncbi:MAG: hypothetical protein IPP34_07595 [Bacteroidetes bacterium]|nr:hypothetical protein [Bacteroidota bacterium]
MGHKKSTRLIIASLIFLIVASVSVYFLIRDNGHKKSEELVELAEQPTDTLILREMFSFKYDLESAADLRILQLSGNSNQNQEHKVAG